MLVAKAVILAPGKLTPPLEASSSVVEKLAINFLPQLVLVRDRLNEAH